MTVKPVDEEWRRVTDGGIDMKVIRGKGFY
jgi:hypothetical protein